MGKMLIELKNRNQEQFFTHFTQNAGICVVDFYAEWCAPCIRLGVVLEKLLTEQSSTITQHILSQEMLNQQPDLLLQDLKKKIVFIKVNVDVFSDLAELYDVSSIPKVIFFKQGELQKNFVNSCDPNTILENVNKLL